MLLSSRSSQAAKGSKPLTGYSSTGSAPRPGQGGPQKGEFGYSGAVTGASAPLLPRPAGWTFHTLPSTLTSHPAPHTYVHTPSNALHPCPGGFLPWKLRSADLLDPGKVIQCAGSDLTHTRDLVRQRFPHCLHLMNPIDSSGGTRVGLLIHF